MANAHLVLVYHQKEKTTLKIYYRHQFLAEVETKIEAEQFIEDYMKKINEYNRAIKNRYYDLADRIQNIKSKRPSESVETYHSYVKENYPKLVSDFEKLGQDYYGDDFVKCFFHDNDENYSGFYIKDKDFENALAYVPLSALFLNCVSKRIYRKLFEIIE